MRIIAIFAFLGAIIGGTASWLLIIDHRTAPHFALVDHTGSRRTDWDYHGKMTILYFGYSFCPDVCPTELGYMSRIIREFGPSGNMITPIFVTVDPKRDTPAKLADYVHLFCERMVGLTGTPEEIDQAAKEFGVFYQQVDVLGQQPGFYLMNHSSIIYVLDQQGVIVDQLDSHVPVSQSIDRIKRFM